MQFFHLVEFPFKIELASFHKQTFSFEYFTLFSLLLRHKVELRTRAESIAFHPHRHSAPNSEFDFAGISFICIGEALDFQINTICLQRSIYLFSGRMYFAGDVHAILATVLRQNGSLW